MPKITQLTSDTSPTNDDFLPIVDNAGSVTKKTTKRDLLKNQPLTNLYGGTTAGVLTTNTSGAVSVMPKIPSSNVDFTTYEYTFARISNLGAIKYSTTEQTLQPGKYLINVTANFNCQNAGGDVAISLWVNNTNIKQVYVVSNTYLSPVSLSAIVTVPTTTTVKIGAQRESGANNTSYVDGSVSIVKIG